MRARALLLSLLVGAIVVIVALIWLGLGSAWGAAWWSAWWTATPPSSSTRDLHTAMGPASDAASATNAPQTARTAVDLDPQGATAATRTVRIEAVFAEDGRPAVGAEVLFWPPRTDTVRARDMKLWRHLDDLEATLRQNGRLVLADASGFASFDAENGSEVAVRCGESYGELELAFEPAPPALPLRVLLHREVTLRVLVTDPQGKPVPNVALVAHLPIASRLVGTDYEHELELGHSDAQGLLVKPHLRLPGANDVDWSMQLRCYGKHLSDTRQPVSLAELRAGAQIHLIVSSGGTIELAVVDEDGRPVPTEPRLRDAESGMLCTPTSRQEDPYLFAQVPLGRTFTAVARDGHSLSIVGPRQDGDVVRAVLTLQERTWQLRGRLCREDGFGLDGARCELGLRASGGAKATTSTTAGAGGRFDCTVRLTGPDLRTARAEGRVWGAMPLVIDRDLAPGVTELGDLLVHGPAGEVLLANFGVCCYGSSIADQVVLDLRGSDGGSRPFVRRRDGDRILLRGVADAGPMSLVCSHPACDALTVPFSPGAVVDVDLQRATRLWLSIEPPSLPISMLRAALSPLGESDGPELEGLEAGLGRFSFANFAPGRYRLRIRAAARLLYESPDLQLRAGDNFWPEDHSRLDLRGSARAIHIATSGADGRTLTHAEFLAVPGGAMELPTDWSDNTGGAWILLPGHAIDVLVRAPDHVPARVSRPLGDVRIALVRNVTVRFVPPDGDGIEIDVRVVRDSVTDTALQRFDEANQHDSRNHTTFTGWQELPFAPGTEFEVRTRRGDVAEPWQRVRVADQGPQEVLLR